MPNYTKTQGAKMLLKNAREMILNFFLEKLHLHFLHYIAYCIGENCFIKTVYGLQIGVLMILRWPDICTPHILDAGQVMQKYFTISILYCLDLLILKEMIL